MGRGYRVVVSDVDGEAARRTAEDLGAARGLEHDVRDPGAHRTVAAAAGELGPLRVWVNNAGVGFDGALADLTEDRARALVEINLMGVMWGMRAALAAMAGSGGDIVNIASLSGLGPVPGLSVYAATKAAVVSLTTSVAAETPRRVRVHALCPDGVATELVEAMEPGGRARSLVSSGGRLLRPEEVAERVLGLLHTGRVVRTVPGWRAGVVRFSALTPGASMRLEPLLRWQGARADRRRTGTSG